MGDTPLARGGAANWWRGDVASGSLRWGDSQETRGGAGGWRLWWLFSFCSSQKEENREGRFNFNLIYFATEIGC